MTFALCLEQTLGHRAHARNLVSALAPDDAVEVHRVEYRSGRHLPWAIDGSWQAFRQLRAGAAPRATLFHTQSVSLFAPVAARGRPYVVSVDATPLQLDTMGRWYAHARGNVAAEWGKRRWYMHAFLKASAIVAWSAWAARSLVRDYGVPPERILVAHPGAGPEFFAIPRPRPSSILPTILFVGGDFVRKGGDVLLEAFRPLAGRARLVLVTGDPVPEEPGVEVVRNATAGSPELLRAFAEADIFCLPTRGDCTSVALEEAMAAGLPVVTTPVGSNGETVRDGEDGLLVPAGDAMALQEALCRLLADPALTLRMGRAAREKAREELDATANARRILRLLQEVSA